MMAYTPKAAVHVEKTTIYESSYDVGKEHMEERHHRSKYRLIFIVSFIIIYCVGQGCCVLIMHKIGEKRCGNLFQEV